MTVTAMRGLIRLAVVLMVVWNGLAFWYTVQLITEERSTRVSLNSEFLASCMKDRPYLECDKDYQKALGGYSLWTEFRKELTPFSIAVVELLPPVIIGIAWVVLWGIL
jgi:hypothetical protein